MSKSKSKEALEQWGGHFIGLGLVGSLLFGPFNIGLILVRELSGWKYWWMLFWKGQWPVGTTVTVKEVCKRLDPAQHGGSVYGWVKIAPKKFSPLDRVEDLRTDLIFQFAGHAVGQAIREYLFLAQPWEWLRALAQALG